MSIHRNPVILDNVDEAFFRAFPGFCILDLKLLEMIDIDIIDPDPEFDELFPDKLAQSEALARSYGLNVEGYSSFHEVDETRIVKFTERFKYLRSKVFGLEK